MQLLFCNHGTASQPGRRAGDSHGKVLCFYFSTVSALPRKYGGFVLYWQIWLCNENITDCRVKGVTLKSETKLITEILWTIPVAFLEYSISNLYILPHALHV